MQLCAVCCNIGQHWHKIALTLLDQRMSLSSNIYIYRYSAAMLLKSSKDFSGNLKQELSSSWDGRPWPQ